MAKKASKKDFDKKKLSGRAMQRIKTLYEQLDSWELVAEALEVSSSCLARMRAGGVVSAYIRKRVNTNLKTWEEKKAKAQHQEFVNEVPPKPRPLPPMSQDNEWRDRFERKLDALLVACNIDPEAFS